MDTNTDGEHNSSWQMFQANCTHRGRSVIVPLHPPRSKVEMFLMTAVYTEYAISVFESLNHESALSQLLYILNLVGASVHIILIDVLQLMKTY